MGDSQDISDSKCGETEDVDIILAATLIKDATATRNFVFKTEEKHIRSYIAFNHVGFKVLLYICVWVNLFVAVFEKPTLPALQLPYWATMTVEGVCLVYIAIRLGHGAYVQEPFHYWRDPKNLTIIFVLVLTVTDMACYCLWINLCTPLMAAKAVRWSRALRPLLLINIPEGRQLRKAFRNIRRTLPDMVHTLILFIANIALFALLCLKLFQNRQLTYPNGRPYFQNYWESFWDLYVLVTTANNPDVKMPAYDANNWYAAVFVVYIMLNLYVLMNIVLAVIYNNYKKHLKNEVRATLSQRRELLGRAFDTVKTQLGDKEVITRDTFHSVMAHVAPAKTKTQVDLLLSVLDTAANNTIERKDFLNLADLLAVKLQTEREDGSIFDRKCHPCYKSKVNERIKMMIRTRYFRWVFDGLTVVNAICIGLNLDEAEWYFLSAFTFEIIAQFYTQGPVKYFRSFWNIFDFVVILAALIVSFVGSALGEDSTRYEILDLLMVLRILRLIRITSSIKRFKIVLVTIVNIGPSIATYGSVIFVVFYVYAIIGMEIFHGRVHYYGYNTTNASELFCGNSLLNGSKFVHNRYCSNNFNSLLHSLMLLFDLLVVNQWHVIAEGYVLVTHKAARIYFITFHMISVIVLLNIFTAFILEAFILEYSMSKGHLQSLVERRIKELGLGVGQNRTAIHKKADRVDLVSNIELPDNEEEHNGKQSKQKYLNMDSEQGTVNIADSGIRFKLKTNGSKRLETLLQLMFEDELAEEELQNRRQVSTNHITDINHVTDSRSGQQTAENTL